MTIDELKAELSRILSEEEARDVDWDYVEHLSERVYVRLTEPDTPQDFPRDAVIGYLAGYLRRKADERFGHQQRQWLMSSLR